MSIWRYVNHPNPTYLFDPLPLVLAGRLMDLFQHTLTSFGSLTADASSLLPSVGCLAYTATFDNHKVSRIPTHIYSHQSFPPSSQKHSHAVRIVGCFCNTPERCYEGYKAIWWKNGSCDTSPFRMCRQGLLMAVLMA